MSRQLVLRCTVCRRQQSLAVSAALLATPLGDLLRLVDHKMDCYAQTVQIVAEAKRPDPDRIPDRTWRIEARDPDQPDQMANWQYLNTVTDEASARERLQWFRESNRIQQLGLVVRARYSETHHCIEDW